ncbi:oligopeptide ABC transporter ATP-binding protein [Oceanococcus atlanticus]|uniref:ABC-type dipeptide transporter n=1 Tax=Oceanococcus atlanticus TaxID=1317117 RepID=A0A1Y1S9U9_9GAMM|nr:ABC transporter ATP-binding protein [Oceanococcus atlanticus]ORE85048.1 oligopeptide ABC transporter ATP-binding protein [Oceanococcus atlanticus]
MSEPLLKVRDLQVEFHTDKGVARALDGISFDVMPGETLGIVGESGCGKSVTSLAILGLIPSPPGRIVGGQILFQGQDLLSLSEREMRKVRGRDIAMIFQEPMTALDPVFTIATQMGEVLRRHQGLTRKQARQSAIDWLARVGIPSPERRIDDYPHQLSGGMRQRVMIAMALSCEPKLIIADEPTTALDVTIQAQVLEQIVKLSQDLGTAMMLITHDLGVVAQTCHRACVMYCGKLIEQSATGPLFAAPAHPYTAGLLASVPRIRTQRLDSLPTIAGTVPDLLHLPRGCRFVERCGQAIDLCHSAHPPLQGDEHSGHELACYNPVQGEVR